MKRILTLVLSIIAFTSFSQTINIGQDITIPTCKPCTTLHAVTNAPSSGTNNYAVTQISYQPYSYLPGTVIPLNIDDRWSNVINLPFPFCFFGNVYTQFIVSSNGQIGFNINLANTFNNWSFAGVNPLPNTTFLSAHNSIMSPYHDMLPSQNMISYNVFGTAPNRVFVVSWNTPLFSCTNLQTTQQIALYETTNIIETYILNKPICANWNNGSAIHGIQNNGGTIAFIVPGRNLPIAGTNQWSAQNDAWRFQPIGGGAGGGQANVQINWYNINDINNPIGTGDSIIVCPNQTKTYVAKATFFLCGGTDIVWDTINIVKQPPIQITINSIQAVSCYMGSNGGFSVNASGGSGNYNYLYNNIPMTGNSQFGLSSGSYTITAIDQWNCSSSITLNITQPEELVLSIKEKGDVRCKYQNSGFVKLNAIGGIPDYLYQLDSNFRKDSNFNYLSAGFYTFYVSDSYGCLDSINIEITQPDSLLTLELNYNIISCLGNDGNIDAIVSGGIVPYSWEWNTNPPQYTSSISNLRSDVYGVVVKDANDCVTSTQVKIDRELCCRVFLPNAFTPNSDGNNDKFSIINRDIDLGEFKIYNRWGQLLFSTKDLNLSWDGRFKGELQDPGTYHYIMIYTCDGVQKLLKGDFILIR